MSELTVVVRRIESDISMRRDYVSLPRDYGKDSYFQRLDIQEIRNLVFRTLDTLEEETGFSEKMIKCRQVVIKPNLVSVYHKSGMYEEDYPESTDPRVLDAVVEWVQRFHKKILIAESSGKPMPTATSFRISGIDRISRFRKTGLVALETCPVRRYLLPKAKVMKEVMIPTPFVGVVEGKDFYISVPKLKTNLYTRVTLGFKNAMGVIPYALRERNHSYRIDEKLADMLYILKPDLTLIDGLVGGEGNTPAPVDPVDSRLLIAGKDPVATDRVGCRIMGFDPDEIPLFQEVEKRGFFHGEPQVNGEVPVFHFRPADASLLGDTFHKHFPNVLVLAGHDLPHAPKVRDPYGVTPETARALEGACRGGCLAAVRSLLAMTEHLEQMISEINGLEKGQLVIATFSSISIHWLPKIIHVFQQNHPGIRIKLMEGGTDDIVNWIEADLVDFGFVSKRNTKSLDWISLYEDPLYAVVPLDYPNRKSVV